MGMSEKFAFVESVLMVTWTGHSDNCGMHWHLDTGYIEP
jgi:hypothetical protein